MMHKERKTDPADNENHDSPNEEKTVRGSGFTYDEHEQHTDQSVPLKKAKTKHVVKLPDLGKPNRP